MSYILSIDQGTSSTKALIFDTDGQAVARGLAVLRTNYFGDGFVEQDAQEIFNNVIESVQNCIEEFLAKGFDKNAISAIGISNQRETFVLWDKDGRPLHRAIVWQCKRSVDVCQQLTARGMADIIHEKTGLLIDPYFSATKLIWLLQNDSSIKQQVERGDVLFGTIDTWLLYKLTDGRQYATDHTNASRTLFFNIHTLNWDQELLNAFGLAHLQLPEIKTSSANYGHTSINGLLEHSVPVMAMIGDSHAAAFGEGCFDPATAKATLGTGSSIMMNIGDEAVDSKNGMVTTICWSIPGVVQYALEGVIVTCGSTIEWLKNQLQLLDDVKSTEKSATSVKDNGGVYLVPAFSGLGSPHWQMERKASITGITFATQKNHIIRAALESIPYQIKDVIAAMEKDTGLVLQQLMTNGGITGNHFVMQLLSNVLNKPVSKSVMSDVSALGAAYMAGLTAGIFKDIDALRKLKTSKTVLQPTDEMANVQKWYSGWLKAIKIKHYD